MSGAIDSYHAHVYFNRETIDQARELIGEAGHRFDLEVGRVHEREVGPHPRWSCQLVFDAGEFAAVIPWLATHRAGLTVFIHPNTGHVLADHTDHAIWMGELLPLNLASLGASENGEDE